MFSVGEVEHEGSVNAFMTESFQQLHRDMFLPTSPREHEGAVKAVMNAFTAPSCSLWEKSAETCFYEAVGSLSVKNAFTAPSWREQRRHS
jgi:hypothetical protein